MKEAMILPKTAPNGPLRQDQLPARRIFKGKGRALTSPKKRQGKGFSKMGLGRLDPEAASAAGDE